MTNFNLNGKKVEVTSLGKREDLRKSNVFENLISYVQIFKSDLLKSTIFWSLKSK